MVIRKNLCVSPIPSSCNELLKLALEMCSEIIKVLINVLLKGPVLINNELCDRKYWLLSYREDVLHMWHLFAKVIILKLGLAFLKL